jgi:2-polyprenyl-3-methyl-5-hydroxy-6-metoxy-1,4-benzoquinol methylase/Zn ribbon nucleic-acid-binding protein
MLKEASKQFLQKSKCPICQNSKIEKYWAMPGYRLAKCLSCGMVWDTFPPENLEYVYSENYFINDNPKGGYANYFEGMNINKRTFYERIKRINKKLDNKEKMLDVGSALGDSLLEARKLGWKDLYGVELSKYAVDESRKRGLSIKLGTLESAKFPSGYFDIVTLQDVIEHIKNPKADMTEIYRILKPGGFVFVVTPDIGGLWHKLLGSFWYHYKPGEHIMYFSQKTLRKVLQDSNFKNIETKRTYHVMSLEYVFNRLRYYAPCFFESLMKAIRNNFLGKLSFKVYAGEIEGWGQK